jgi:indole-3-glycerol phosphate synthase/phosphoribosylanthranilate isomerase
VKPFVKICGLTRPGDARLAVALGATHIGVVRTESSPRSVRAAEARDIFAAAEGKAETVFVFRDIPLRQVIEDAQVSGARGVQLYDASDDDVRAASSEGLRVYRVYGMERDSSRLPRFESPPTEAQPALLDVGGGGSGRRFDWALLGDRAPRATFIAGGIRPDNVGALLKHRPYGIDLASGVESEPGFKDENKLRALFEELS